MGKARINGALSAEPIARRMVLSVAIGTGAKDILDEPKRASERSVIVQVGKARRQEEKRNDVLMFNG